MIPISFAIAAVVITPLTMSHYSVMPTEDALVATETDVMARTTEAIKEVAICQLTIDVEDTYISEKIQNECIAVGEERGYCPELLMAIIESESSGRQYAENGSCKGLMQINMSNSDVVEYMDEQGYTDIFDIYTNIEMGCYVLDQKREIFGDDLYAVLMSYNGSKNVGERIDNENYTDYAVHIVERSWELERIHGK
jgi:hypothetical protein